MGQFAVIVAAAGRGERFGAARSKIFAKVDNRPMFLRALELFVNREDVCQLILAVAGEDLEHLKEKYGANLGFMGVEVCAGGQQRWETVARALPQVREEAAYVAIHDAARVCTTPDMIDRAFAEAAQSKAAVLAAPVTATLKQVSADGFVQDTVQRSALYEAQTPQVFEKVLLRSVYDSLPHEVQATDDAELVAAAGHPVKVVDSDLSNLKITYPGDIALASAILKSRPKPKPSGPRGPFEEAQW